MSQTELLNISRVWSDNFLIVGILLVGESGYWVIEGKKWIYEK